MNNPFDARVPINVQPGGINSSIRGIKYQVHLMLLTVIKSFREPTNPDFEASTEIAETEPFDDVILKVNNTTRFIQCKFKTNPNVLNFLSFFDKQNKTYYLARYFLGYIKIEKTFRNNKFFVICTNNKITTFHNDRITLSDMITCDEISFLRDNGNDLIFENFNERFKFDQNCITTKTTIRSRLIQDLARTLPDATQQVDINLNGFLSNLLFVFDLKREDINGEIDDFIQSEYNLSIVDCPKSVLVNTLSTWIENLESTKTINRQSFKDHLINIKDISIIVPKVIDRSSALFRSSEFEFKSYTGISEFIKKVESGPNQTFYMQMVEGDTFYGSCMVNQKIKPKASDEFLFLSTICPFDIEDGLKIFSMRKCFDFLIFVENKEKPIEDSHKKQIKDILSKHHSKRALIITDQIRLKFSVDIIENDENLFVFQEVKLSDLTQQSLERFLDKKELKLQDEVVKFKNILDSTDQNLVDSISLKNLTNIQSMGRNVINGKNFDPDLYIPRKLLHRNIIRAEIFQSRGENENFVSDSSLFDTCCNEFPDDNVHLIKPQMQGSDLVWEKTKGKIDYLFEFVNPSTGSLIKDPWDSNCTAGNVFVLVDDPGMGKTSWLNYLAQKLKKKYTDHFIVNISFNDHTEYFQEHKLEDETSVLNFFAYEELKLRNDTENLLFQAACTKTGKVQIIFDGLDEICPEYEAEMIKMIAMMRKLPVSGIYVSTRAELKRVLEEKLQNFSHMFLPFSEEDQLCFLTKFWYKNRKGNLADDDLQAVAKKVILFVKKKKLTEITGIPLITRMVAEIFDSDMIINSTLDDSVMEETFSNLSHLYEVFVDKKIERYLTEKLELDMSKNGNRIIAKTIKLELITLYKKMALKLIIPQYTQNFYENIEFTSENLKSMRKYGLIINDSESKFIHRTVAEYFVCLLIREKFNNVEIATFVVQKVFCEANFAVIRLFLKGSIDKFSDSWELYGNILLEREIECRKSIEILCEENNAHILEFIFQSVFALKSNIAMKFATKMIDQNFLKLYTRNVNDDFNIFKLIERELGLETLRNLFLTNNFEVLKLSTRNSINFQQLLFMMRQKFDNTEFWKSFEKNSNKFLTDLFLEDCDKGIFNLILIEFSLIEIEKNICCFEVLPVFDPKRLNEFKFEIVAQFLSYFINCKGLKTFMSIFDIKIRQNYDLFVNLLEVLMLDKISPISQLLDVLMKIAFRQLLIKSATQNQNYYEDIRQKLSSEILKNVFDEEKLREFQEIPEIFEVCGENVKFVNDTEPTCWACLYLNQNYSAQQVIQIFFHDLLEFDNFDRILYPLIQNFSQMQDFFGRFIFDHLNYEDTKAEDDLGSSVMTVKDFCMKLRNKHIETYITWFRSKFNANFTELFLFFTMHSMILSMRSEEDKMKFKKIVLFEYENSTVDWPGYFFGFWKHCTLNISSHFDFDLYFATTEKYRFECFALEDRRMVLTLYQWIAKQFGNEHHTLEYQDNDGNTLMHFYSKKASSEDLRFEPYKIISNKILGKILTTKNTLGQTFLFDIQKSYYDYILPKIKEDFGYNYLENLLLQRDLNGNVFIVTAPVQFFSQEFNPILSKETLVRLILNRNLQGRNFLFVNLNFNCSFIHWIFEEFGLNQELFEELLNSRDGFNETFLEYVQRSRISRNTELWEHWTEKEFDQFDRLTRKLIFNF